MELNATLIQYVKKMCDILFYFYFTLYGHNMTVDDDPANVLFDFFSAKTEVGYKMYFKLQTTSSKTKQKPSMTGTLCELKAHIRDKDIYCYQGLSAADV